MRRTRTRACVLAGLVSAAAGLAGCNIVGPAAYLLGGPEKTPAVHELDEKQSVVVFIDDRNHKMPERSLRSLATQVAEQQLLDRKIVEKVIAGEAALNVAARERFGQPLGIAEIGESVGADVVVYATIDEFTLASDGASFTPRATARVKVVEVAGKRRLWPTEDPGWHTLSVNIADRQGMAPQSPAAVASAQRELAEKLGDGLAKLFYSHERPALHERRGS